MNISKFTVGKAVIQKPNSELVSTILRSTTIQGKKVFPIIKDNGKFIPEDKFIPDIKKLIELLKLNGK